MPINSKGERLKKKPGEDPRDFDTTALKSKVNGTYVHRDYAAHYFRWGFAERWIGKDHDQRVLDIGCGPEQALCLLLRHHSWPRELVTVDYAPVKNRCDTAWHTLLAPFDFTRDYKKIPGKFDVITCLEVIEHMHKDSGLKLLRGAKHLLEDEGVLLLSTPCYDGGRHALNHIHEYTVDELDALITKAGLRMQRRFGTFMDLPKVKKIINQYHRKTFEDLQEYYSPDVLSTFLAPLYPDLCRNNMWVIRK